MKGKKIIEQISCFCLMVGERLCLKAMEKDLARRLEVEKTQSSSTWRGGSRIHEFSDVSISFP